MDSLLIYESDSDSEDDPPLSTSHTGDDGNRPALSTSDNVDDANLAAEHVGGCTEGSSPIQQHSVLPPLSASAPGTILPPPPEDLLTNTTVTPGSKAWNEDFYGGRIRNFPHVEGNYALHVYIPVTLPSYARKEVGPIIYKARNFFPGLQLLEEGFIHRSLGDCESREVCSGSAEKLKLSGEYHISLSRTVPIRIHQIESIKSMLRHKFSSQKRYIAEFSSWAVFPNDERTRTFLSLEITTAGLSEIQNQVFLVDEVFRLHDLPTFYTNPRPHISLAWASGEVTSAMMTVADELNKINARSKNVGVRTEILWSSQGRCQEGVVDKLSLQLLFRFSKEDWHVKADHSLSL